MRHSPAIRGSVQIMTDKAKRLYVVDDDDDFRRFVKNAAERHDWTVVECRSGSELIAHCADDPDPGKALLDILMPDMDGFETMLRLAVSGSKIEISLITGGAPTRTMVAEEYRKSRSLNVSGVFTKPISLAEIDKMLAPCA